jgi:hypothetical protein
MEKFKISVNMTYRLPHQTITNVCLGQGQHMGDVRDPLSPPDLRQDSAAAAASK